jgi:imidazolonepropionase-like amidohydrolase
MLAKLFLALFLVLASTSLQASTVWLKGASIVDPKAQTITRGDIKIVQGRVRYVKGRSQPAKGDQIIDVTGKWIIPGIYDLHVHTMFGNQGPNGHRQAMTALDVSSATLYAGVTGFLDLFADEATIFEARNIVRTTHEGADIFAAGPMLTCTGGHGSDLGVKTRIINSPREAEEQMAQLAQKHPDVVKVAYDHVRGPTMDIPTLTATIQAAKRRGFKTVVHIGTWSDAEEAMTAGADVITHLYLTDIPDRTVAMMKEKKIIEIPTMTYQAELLHILENRSLLSAPLLVGLLPPDLLSAYRNMQPETDSFLKSVLETQVKGRDSYPRSLAKLVKAGIPILSGTDAGDLAVFHGYAIHRELVYLVEAGATTWQALNSATSAAKMFLDQPSGIKEGDRADLVVLGGNPIEDITNTQTVEQVFHYGRLVDRKRALAHAQSN